MRSIGMLFCASKIQNRDDCFLWNIDILFDKTIVASNFIDIDDTASTELTRDKRRFCTREEKNKRKECDCPAHGDVDFNMINFQESTAWNSLFKCIKIQRMQVL